MAATMEARWLEAFSAILDGSHLFQPDGLATAVDAALAPLGIDATIYLVDEEQRVLCPVPRPGAPLPPPQPVETTAAGRAFAMVTSKPRGDGGWCVPMVNGTDRLGVVEFEIGEAEPEVRDGSLRARCETLAGLIGHLVTVTSHKGDFLAQVRRSRSMTPAAELLRQLLPPLTSACDRMVISAILEPCYDVGGDGFDYAIDGARARIVILDAVGHGLAASLACGVAMSALRAVRRDGGDLRAQARAADTALTEQFPDSRFVTAVLAELDLEAGRLRYINAGHPRPLLLRTGRVVHDLAAGRRMPLGVHDDVEVAEEDLEGGDRLLLYTDGVTEARDAAGEEFGVRRLIDLTERHASAGLPAPETLRRLAHAVAEHQGGAPADDATLVLAEWSPVAALRSAPYQQRLT
ncbi:PP2C family protein-serine/threonine phosphatase [Dactylosporangium sp. NPDC050588]|uniref:PP2C family protein-serine/threonine phosphatase n=1 Tax=Dactylosporangium sp. NPDC050588 TaxID=3157211 RepID=UPI0034084E9D